MRAHRWESVLLGQRQLLALIVCFTNGLPAARALLVTTVCIGSLMLQMGLRPITNRRVAALQVRHPAVAVAVAVHGLTMFDGFTVN